MIFLGGCATSRSVLDVSAPVSRTVGQANGKEVFIGLVSDKRVFEENPSEPNIPSMDPSEAQDQAMKLRAIGRKRNGFGKALGDIVLQDGKSVESLTMGAIRQAFVEKGYRVVDNKDAAANAYLVTADVNKFWAWMNPGFAAITLNTEIATDLSLKSLEGSERISVSVKAADYFQTGMEGNWVEVINKALQLYVDDLKAKLK